MKFVTVRDFRTKPKEIWNDLSKEKMMTITINGKPVAMLISTSDKNYEDSLDTLRKVRAEKAVMTMQNYSLKAGLNNLSETDIEDEIKAVRAKVKNENRS